MSREVYVSLIMIFLCGLFLNGWSNDFKNKVIDSNMMEINLPNNEKNLIDYFLSNQKEQLIKEGEGKLIPNNFDIERRELYKLNNGNVLHIHFYDGSGHIYSSLEDYEKNYSENSIIKEMIIINYQNDYCYKFELKFSKINTFIDNDDFVKSDIVKLYSHEKLYKNSTGNYIVLPEKSNSLSWFYDEKNLLQCYQIFYLNKEWLTW